MSTTPTSPLRNAWYRWKSLKLPWRKRFLVGLDLQGNTFWEFRDTLSTHKNRMRRIVQYPASTPYSDIKISPQWHQWLRHTRSDPPSISEQSQDIIRQQNLKVLAAEADARWAAKPSFLDSPGEVRGKPLPALESKSLGAQTTSTDTENSASVGNAIEVEPKDVTERRDISADSEEKPEHNGIRQVPDCPRHNLFEKPRQETRSRAQKDKEDPWQQARAGEKWQPAAWSGNITVRR